MPTRWAVILLLLAIGKTGFIIGIRLKNVTIPHYGVKDGSVRLGCEFVLESDSLLVLKWYKDEQEFFRFTPSTTPQQQILTFPSEGVFVDVSQSGLSHMVLRNLTLNTTGLYKCEVSAEGSFRTLSGQGSLVVVAPPQSGPLISGIRPVVNVGDVLSGNCTLRRSKPAATLMFYINDEKVEQNLIEYAPYVDLDGLETSFVGFNLLVELRHFINGKMNIKCMGRIGDFYWAAAKNVSNANIIAQPSYTGGQNRLSSSGAESSTTSSFPFSSIAYTSLLWYGCIIFGLLVLGIIVTFCINYKQSKNKPSRRNSRDDVGVSDLGLGGLGLGVGPGGGGVCVSEFKYRI